MPRPPARWASGGERSARCLSRRGTFRFGALAKPGRASLVGFRLRALRRTQSEKDQQDEDREPAGNADPESGHRDALPDAISTETRVARGADGVEVVTRPRIRRGAASLAELAHTIQQDLEGGRERDALRLLFGFADDFRRSSRPGAIELIAAEPAPTGDERFDAALAGVAEFFATERGLATPGWVDQPGRFVEPLWFVASRPEFDAYTLAHTPATFARHGVLIAREVFDRA